MENTALNDATTKDQDWKQKKGYAPLIVLIALLFGTAFCAGQIRGTSLDRDEKETQNVAASSSSMSLVGSSTAASDLKTLTIVVDDDELIDGLLSGWTRAEKPMGGSSAYCKKNTGYNCGAVFPPDGDTCDQKGCCCHEEDGSGKKLNTCDNAKGYAYRGCSSCWGRDACFKTNNINAGTSSCHGKKSCAYVSDSTIGNDSCQGLFACYSVQNSTIHDGSCRCHDCCEDVKNSIIGKGSCNDGDTNCAGLENKKIGNNSCNNGGNINGGVCNQCKHNVPDNACNTGITDDMDINGYCNYCL